MHQTQVPEGDPRAARSQPKIRPCREDESEAMLAIINSAAEAYRVAIPADCWHEPYMPAAELRSDIAAGITFVGYEIDGLLAGVMGIQPVRNVDLIRHAYVLPAYQGHGVGSALLAYLRAQALRQILVGTWTAATWAIRFYERHGLHLVPETTKALLLTTYWTISERQIETSVVLAAPRLTGEDARNLVERSGAL
jgi:GNAT superfamily N-acetyltransferase